MRFSNGMKFGIARRHWKLGLVLSACVAAGIAALGPSQKAEAVLAVQRPFVGETPSATRPLSLAKRESLGRLRTDPFTPRSWTPPPAPPPPAPVISAPAEPTAPPNPYRFAGTVRYGGILRVALAAGERIHLVKGGEIIDDLYRVEAVSRDAVRLVYLPLGIEHQLAYTGDAPQSPPQAPAVQGGPLARNAP
jgi:hypothetical protein